MYNPFKKQEPKCLREFIIGELEREGIYSDCEIINSYGKFMRGWDSNSIYMRGSSISKMIRKMRLKGEIIEVKRVENLCKNAGGLTYHTIYYKLK